MPQIAVRAFDDLERDHIAAADLPRVGYLQQVRTHVAPAICFS
jgi:hypothetical protein